jgi:outer membrane protein OmpA-like peptidoglycan-associated protein
MKRFAACALAFALLAMCGLAVAGPYNPPKHWDDLSWWGKSGATPAPVKDAKVNAYWWWPKEPTSNADDQELWGNRGKVLHNALPTEEAKVEQPKVEPPKPIEEVKIPLFNNVLFDYNKSFLRPEGKQEVDRVVQFMKDHADAKATITGHASNEGTDQYNVALGQRRADAVRDYMVQQGIAPERLNTVSKGESEPAVPNDTEPNRKLNRRAVFDISLPGAAPAAK